MNTFASLIFVLSCLGVATLGTRLATGAAHGPLTRFLTGFLIFFACFFGVFHLLGLVNLLTGFAVVNGMWAAAIGLIVLAGTAYQSREEPPAGRIGPTRIPGTDSRLSGPARVLTISASAVFAFAALTLVAGYARGFESVAYHLPVAVHFFQEGTLRIWDTAFMHTLPSNGGIYLGFLLSFLPERLVSAANLVFLVPVAAAIYGLGLTTGADRNASALGAIGFVTIPMVAFSSFEASADVAGAAFLATAVYFALARPLGRWPDVALAGLGVGLAFGFKNLHAVSINFLLILIVVQTWRSTKETRRAKLSAAGRDATVFMAFASALSAFWLIRNLVELGNPFYPVHLGVFDLFGWARAPDWHFEDNLAVQFKWVGSSLEWLAYPWVEGHLLGGEHHFKHNSGLGAFFAATVPVAALLAVIATFRGDPKRRFTLAALLSGAALVLVAWSVTQREPRYFMGALIFLAPLVPWVLSQTRGKHRRVYEYIAAICLVTVLLIIVTKTTIFFGDQIVYSKGIRRHVFLRYPPALDDLPAGSTVVNLCGRGHNFSLYGRHHRNRVVSRNEAFRVLVHREIGMAREWSPESVRLPEQAIRELHATHLLSPESLPLLPGPGVELREIGRYDAHPVTGKPLTDPRLLYEVLVRDER